MIRPNSTIPLYALALLAAQMLTITFEARAARNTPNVTADTVTLSTASDVPNGNVGWFFNGNDTLTISSAGSITLADSTPDIHTRRDAVELEGGHTGAIGNNTVINDGTITTNGPASYGIRSRIGTSGNTITNNNSITTNGLQAHGIAAGSNDTITNTGTITITGRDAHGITFGGNNNSLDNTGDITVSGTSGIGVFIGASTGHTVNNTGSITTSSGNGISGSGESSITTLTNTVNSTKSGDSGLIRGRTHGISIGRIGTLTNNVGARIIGQDGDGVIMSNTGSAVTGTIINHGTIQGRTAGIQYGINTISSLTNSGTIQGGTGAGLAAGAITRLDNQIGGRILSTGNDGISVTGNIGELTNNGDISGDQRGISAASIGTLTNNKTITGTTGNGLDVTGVITKLTNNRGAEISGGLDGVSAASVDLENFDTITGGTATTATANNAAVKLGVGASTVVNVGKITGERGDGIGGIATSVITTLSNTVNSGMTGSGAITGDNNGIRVGSIGRLTNNAGATIEGGTAGAGIKLLGTAAGEVNVTNRGTIKGGTQGMDYLANTITKLENKDTGRIEGGSGEGVKTTGAITELDNDGEISGGTDGVSAASVDLDNSGTIKGGTFETTGATAADNAAVKLTGSGPSKVLNTGNITGTGVTASAALRPLSSPR